MTVHHLPTSDAVQALTLARAYQPDYLDRILAAERRELSPTPTADEIIDQIVTAGDAVRFADHHWPGGIIRGLLDRLKQTRRERDQARGIAAALEQQLGEIEAIAVKWTAMHGTRAGMGHLLLDITCGDRDDEPATPA